MEHIEGEPDRLRAFGVAFIGTLLAGGILLWMSNLTSGPQYGGAWDLPAVNYVSWFGFLACMAAAIMIGAGALLRIVGMGWDSLIDRRMPE